MLSGTGAWWKMQETIKEGRTLIEEGRAGFVCV